ncbi:MAG TPA: hypothetical protein VHQ20_02885 [Patescibacteria group bacterium]|jgi:hypothetical protein|nr:hypothetical protein [Patescibacteria group bacterium]
MIDEKWEQFVENAQDKFESVETYPETTEDGKNDVVEFTLPQAGDRYKVVRENRPVVLDKIQHFSHRQGDTARTEYVLSDTELSHKIRVYKEDNYGEWEEVRAESLGL